MVQTGMQRAKGETVTTDSRGQSELESDGKGWRQWWATFVLLAKYCQMAVFFSRILNLGKKLITKSFSYRQNFIQFDHFHPFEQIFINL
jgi:hypothetical protein